MNQLEFMWECACGHVEYNKIFPKKCIKCGKKGEFVQVPETDEESSLSTFKDGFFDEVIGDEE